MPAPNAEAADSGAGLVDADRAPTAGRTRSGGDRADDGVDADTVDDEAARDDVAGDEATGAETPAWRRRPGRGALDHVDRYLPVIAIGGMVATYLQVPPYFALTFIGAVWLFATRVTRNHTFLGLSLTEGLAWAATVLILLFIAALVLGGAQ